MAEQFAGSLAGKVVADSWLITKFKREIGYAWNCKKTVEKLRSEVRKLKDMKDRVEQKIKQAHDNGDGPLAGVEKWVNEALAHISTTEEFLQEEDAAKKTCFNLRMCVNLNSLHHYGKEATKKVLSLEQHRSDGADFERDVAKPNPSLASWELGSRVNIDYLDTHKSVLEKIIESLKDESTQITGIYGIGGVGKTTLATEVAALDLFHHVVFVTVSQPLDAASIKKIDIAAKRIKYSGEKVLIILDDVWTELKLHEVGIPCGTDFPSCKILLTSRQRSVCTVMKAHTIIYVQPLPIEEALALFKRVVGENCDNLKVVREIVEACGGLPLLLQAAGNALKNEKNIKEWRNARNSIKKHLTLGIDPSIRSEFSLLRLSYDRLNCEEAKSIFLLCCVFPDDYHISLEKLAQYRVGFHLFFKDMVVTLEDAREKVEHAVKILKSSCLLLDGEDESTIKMHDVVRKVALLIASKDKKFWVEAGKNLIRWEPKMGSHERCTCISVMRNDICKLPASSRLNLPFLGILLIQENYNLREISDEFFRAMKEVQVIDFEYNNISYLPKSMKQLKKLRMLNLGGNKRLCDVSILGDLEDLEILILRETGIKKIPQEIGKLDKLRLFDAARCPALSHIEPGVLSKLCGLEELCIQYNPFPVEREGNNCLKEIGELSNLTSLKLWVQHICLIPPGHYLKRLKRFSFQIGGSEDYSDYETCIRGNKTLFLDTLDCLFLDTLDCLGSSPLMHVRNLLEVCNGIGLRLINNLDKIMDLLYSEGFGLKAIHIIGCDNLLHLATSHQSENRMFLSKVKEIMLTDLDSLEVISNCYINLNNLVTLEIMGCHKLEKLFSVSVAQGLDKLKELKIQYCDNLKEVISDRDGETSTSEIETVVSAKEIVFRCLAKIWLDGMESLTSFYPGNATIKYHSLVEVVIRNCNNMEKWGYRTQDTPNPQFVKINGTKVNGSTIDEALAKNREAEKLLEKQRQDQRLVSTEEEGPSSVCEE